MAYIDTVRDSEKPLVAPLAGFPGIALTNSTIRENLNDARLQARTIVELHKAVEMDVVFPMMDLTVETEALGGRIDWETDEMPAIKGIAVESIEQAEAITIPEIGQDNRLNVFVETCARLREALPEKTIWGYALGPFSIAGRLMGMTEIAIATKLEPETVHAVLRKANALLKNYISALLDTGIDGVMILEPASSLLRADDADEFSNVYVSELVALMKSRGKTAGLHNCGSIDHVVERLCATGIDVLSVGSVTDPMLAYEKMPADTVLMGNLDPTEVFLRGTPDEIREAALKLSDRMADCERFVISSGCDLPPGVSIENLNAFAQSAKPLARV